MADCTCAPCTTPGYGYPGLDHCAACCYGTLISVYNLDCPVWSHRVWARRQHGLPPEPGDERVGEVTDTIETNPADTEKVLDLMEALKACLGPTPTEQEKTS